MKNLENCLQRWMEWVAEVVLNLARAAAVAEEAILIGWGILGSATRQACNLSRIEADLAERGLPIRRDRWQTEMVFGAESHVVSAMRLLLGLLIGLIFWEFTEAAGPAPQTDLRRHPCSL